MPQLAPRKAPEIANRVRISGGRYVGIEIGQVLEPVIAPPALDPDQGLRSTAAKKNGVWQDGST
jgi:hypothetical protein